MNSYLFYIRPCDQQMPAHHRYISAKTLPEAWSILGVQLSTQPPVKTVKYFATLQDLLREFPESL